MRSRRVIAKFPVPNWKVSMVKVGYLINKNCKKLLIYQLFKPINGVPKGIRTPVTAVKGRCPRPLDDGDVGS